MFSKTRAAILHTEQLSCAVTREGASCVRLVCGRLVKETRVLPYGGPTRKSPTSHFGGSTCYSTAGKQSICGVSGVRVFEEAARRFRERNDEQVAAVERGGEQRRCDERERLLDGLPHEAPECTAQSTLRYAVTLARLFSMARSNQGGDEWGRADWPMGQDQVPNFA